MKKENNLNEVKNQDILNKLENILQEYEEVKTASKKYQEYLKLENKINKIQEVNEYCFKLFESKNKYGFMKIINHDFYKYFLKKFYETNHVFIKQEENNKLFILFESEESLKACCDFKAYYYSLQENFKKKKEESKRKLLNKNVKDFKLLSYKKEDLESILLQVKERLKDLKKEENK